MRIRIVDAFTDQPFSGNPAGVLLLDSFPDDTWLQKVAAEVNLSETAFAHPLPAGGEADWALRWFTPATEVDMCGHATLATAHVLHSTGAASGAVRFAARCGVLGATTEADGTITMDFPTSTLTPVAVPVGLEKALGAEVLAVHDTAAHIGDLVVELRDESTVRALAPDFAALKGLSSRGIIVTAAAERPDGEYDFVSAASSPASASTRTRSPAAPTPRSPPTGRPGSAATTSSASRAVPVPASSAPACAASAPS